MKKIDHKTLSQNYNRNLLRSTVSTNIGINNTERLIKVYGKGATRIELLNKLQKQSKFKIYWYTIFVILGLACLIIEPKSWFTVLDLFVVMVNIDLVARGKLSGIIVGITECFLYAFVCLQSQLYGEIVKTLGICVPLNIFSIISWTLAKRKTKKEKYKKTDDDEIVIKRLSKKQKALYLLVFAGIVGASYCLLRFALKQQNALILGAVSLSITILCKILTARRFMDSWIIGICGDIICMLMWGQTIIETGFELSQLAMIVYYLACFTNDINAYGLWKNMYRKVAVNGGVLLAKRKVNIKRIVKLRRQFKNLHWDREVDTTKNT